jgi:hypothetical protein
MIGAMPQLPTTILAFTLAACAAGRQDVAPSLSAAEQGREQIPPAGFGTLRVDDIALLFQTPDLRIRVLPLDERVIRLLSPDSYESLAGLKRVKAAQIDDAARQYGVADPALFSVSFYGLRERATFAPEELTLESRGRFFRPVASVPLSPGWGERQVAQRGSALAIVLYEPGMSLFGEDLLVTYQGYSSAAWDGIAKTLERERVSVMARAAAAGKQ